MAADDVEVEVEVEDPEAEGEIPGEELTDNDGDLSDEVLV